MAKSTKQNARMSERQYFALRYAIPGFAFILLIIGLNFVPLLKFLEVTKFSDSFGAFLAFLTLFSGSAIGFLISQFWWLWWQHHFGILRVKQYKESLKAFLEKFEFREKDLDLYLKSLTAEEKRQFHTAVDYVSHYKAEKETLVIAERRWDMYHMLSATKIALFWGLLSGVVFRLYYQFVFVANFDWGYFIPKGFDAVGWTEFLASFLIIGFAIALIIALCFQKGWILTISAALHEARIRESKVSAYHLRKVFPALFAEDNTGNETKPES
jgi:hypothetical protein